MAYDNPHSDTRKDVAKAVEKSTKPAMFKCPHCGKKSPTGSNSIGGSAAGGGS